MQIQLADLKSRIEVFKLLDTPPFNGKMDFASRLLNVCCLGVELLCIYQDWCR